jgi:DNA-binding transcriptional regulator YhcF (GntR family)
MSGWIKIHRQILDWEWYSDNNAFRVFMHLILKANHKDKRFKGMELKAGSVVTSRDILAIETGLSVRQIRTALDKLKSTNEVTIKTSSQGTIIEVVNYIKYQLTTSETTNERPANDQQTTNNKNIKKERSTIYSFLDSLIQNGFDEKLSRDWMEVRKQRKAVNTETAFNDFLTQVQKHGGNKNEILRTCVERSWKGFNHSWIEKEHDKLLANLNK